MKAVLYTTYLYRVRSNSLLVRVRTIISSVHALYVQPLLLGERLLAFVHTRRTLVDCLYTLLDFIHDIDYTAPQWGARLRL